MIRKDKHSVSAALFGVAAIQGVVGLFGWWIHGAFFEPIDWVITFSFAVFVGLALLARRAKIAAAVMGAGLYVVFLSYQGLVSTELLKAGLVFKVPICLLLVGAVIVALRRKGEVI
jgi:hypothetical protein